MKILRAYSSLESQDPTIKSFYWRPGFLYKDKAAFERCNPGLEWTSETEAKKVMKTITYHYILEEENVLE